MGICNSKLSKKLQLDPDLTLASTITQVRQSETIKSQQPLLHGKPDTPVGAVQKGRGGLRPNRGSPNSVASSHKYGKDSCLRCGRYPAHEKAQCLPMTRFAETATSVVTSELSAGQLLKSGEWTKVQMQSRVSFWEH